MYSEDGLLPLSGIQHFSYCPRQWGLIHIERYWEDNLLTAQGNLMHSRVHEDSTLGGQAGAIITRSLPLVSLCLGLTGIADVVEFTPSPTGIALDGAEGLFTPYPIEYKRGKPKDGDWDRLQVCAQALCLEEMLGIPIDEGALYYGKTRRRERVSFGSTLRTEVARITAEMHQRFYQGAIPAPVTDSEKCRSCSLAEVCLPESTDDISRQYWESIMEANAS